VCATNGACGDSSIAAGSACTCAAQCNPSQCSVSVSCVNEGAGAVCACTCNWGTDCESGCCVPVVGETFSVCAAASNCVGLGAACTQQSDCLNNNCGTFKTYCYDDNSSTGVCGCGCSVGTDCTSGCCVSWGTAPNSYLACGNPTVDVCN
jgi:hypothetical protein